MFHVIESLDLGWFIDSAIRSTYFLKATSGVSSEFAILVIFIFTLSVIFEGCLQQNIHSSSLGVGFLKTKSVSEHTNFIFRDFN